MKKILANVFLGVISLGFAAASSVASADEGEAAYKAAKNSAAETYKIERAKCDTLSGNQKDVCVKEAKMAEKRSKAEAEAQYTAIASEKINEIKSEEVQRKRNTDYKNAIEKCESSSGSVDDACVARVNLKYGK